MVAPASAARHDRVGMELYLVQRLAVAITLGLLVGFQREWSASPVAGIRTFTLITLLGTLLAITTETLGAWPLVAGLLAVAALVIVFSSRATHDPEHPGMATEVALLVMFVVGALVGLGWVELGLLVGGVTAVLLQWKAPLHAFVGRLNEQDVRAITQLVLIALVVLPVLPDRNYGPSGVLNPFEIWLMVVLIVGISLGGYLAFKFLGPGTGTLVSGILGGLISSTAVTASYARHTHGHPSLVNLTALIITIASTVMFARVLTEVYIVAPEVLPEIAAPLVIMMVILSTIALGLHLSGSHGSATPGMTDEEPSALTAAILFGALYGAVLLAVAVARARLGSGGLYLVAALSGLTDMDAITLSTAQMIRRGAISGDMGWRMILVGALSNLGFKSLTVAVLGDRRLTRRILVAFGLAGLGGAGLLIWWP